jgi:predicted ArsR family transcriptional regulator
MHREVLDVLVRRQEWRAEELAAELYLSEGAVRTHLNVLSELGFVDVRQERQGPGRPRHFYSVSSRGRATFATGYAHWLRAVFEALEQEHPDVYAGLGEAMVRGALRSPDLTAETPERQVSELTRHLAPFGHKFSIDVTDEETRIEVFNCGAFRVAREHPMVCETERGWLETFYPGGEARLKECMVNGDQRCVMVVERQREPADALIPR